MDEPRAAQPLERFVLHESLGAGTSGCVYRAYDRERGTTVAIKVLERLDAGSLFRFKGEFRQLANMSHPNLLQLYELTARGDQWVLSMELIEGTDFLRYVRPPSQPESLAPEVDFGDDWGDLDTEVLVPGSAERCEPRPSVRARPQLGDLDVPRLRSALRQLCEGLRALHLAGRLHRDLKPDNVLVTAAEGRVVICDFGLVVEVAATGRVSEAPGSTAPHTYGVEGIAGTLAYMSPEQALGNPLSEASDWYAVGAMLYHALTRRLPFEPSASWTGAALARLDEVPLHPLALSPEAPSDLASLALALLDPDPEARPGYTEIVSVLDGRICDTQPVAPDLALVGRTRELEQLRSAFVHARAGDATVALVVGPSGIGKSALLRAFLRELSDRQQAIVLSGRCYEREDLPHKALDPLVDALSTCLLELDAQLVSELVPAQVQALARMFPVLRRVPVIAERTREGSEAADLHTEKRRAGAALRELCARLARVRPLVLCIDDLQWGDLDCVPLLSALLRAPSAPAMLVLCAYRSEDETRAPLVRALRDTLLPSAGPRPPIEVRLGALASEVAHTLAREMLRGVHDSSAAAALVTAEAEGSPILLRELASYIRIHGLAAARHLGLEGVVEARVRALSPPSRLVLSLIALAVRPVRRAVLDAAAALGEATLAAYRPLEAQQLVQSSGAGTEERVEPYHDHIRRAALALVPDDERASLHRKLAQAIEAVDGAAGDPDLLFQHWCAAGERARAGQLALSAAQKAEGALAFERAIALYRTALALLEPEPVERRTIDERLGLALMYAGRGPEAAAAFLRATEGAAPARAIELRSLATTQLVRAGLLEQAFAELARAEHLLAMRAPRTTRSAKLMLAKRRLQIRLHGLRLHAPPRGGVSPEMQLRMDLLWGLASALYPVDQLRGSVYQAEHMLLAMRSGDRYRFARALAMESATSATANRDPARTQWIIDRGLEHGGASCEPHSLSAVKGTAGVCRLLEGRFVEALRLLREAQQINDERLHGMLVWDRAIVELFELRACALAGDVGELTRRVPELLRDAEARGDLFAAVSLRTAHCVWAWLGPDQVEIARAEVATAIEQWSPHGDYQLQHWHATQAVGEIALYAGDALDPLAEASARLAREWSAMGPLRRRIQFTRCEVLYLRARLALAAARARLEPRLLEQAERDAHALASERTPWIEAHACLLRGCLASFDDADHARALLHEAEGRFDAVDMRLAAAVCAYRAAQLEADPESLAVERAGARVAALGAQRPEAFVRMLAPGFPQLAT